MVALQQTFNTADLPDTGGKTVLIPDGRYPAIIVKSDLVENSFKTGSFLALTVVITQGQYAGKEFIERLNIINPNADAVNMSYRTLARISEALGMTQTPADTNTLHNKPLIIETETEKGEPWKDKDGKERKGADKSIIKKWHPVSIGNANIAGPTVNAAGSPFAAHKNW